MINWIVGCKFNYNKVQYVIDGVWWHLGKKVEYEFKSTDMSKKIAHYKMEAEKFESKIKEENFVGMYG